MAVSWTTFGFTLIYIGLLAGSAVGYGGFSVPEGDLMTAEELERRTNLEKQ